MGEVADYLDSKSIEYKRQGKELLILCPFCGKNKLSINEETLLYKCWSCVAKHPDSPFCKGHLSTLQKEWGDIVPVQSVVSKIQKEEKKEKDLSNLTERYHSALLNNKKALKYLILRGFTLDDIKKFKFGYLSMKGENWVSIPSYEDGIPKLLKYRKITNNNPEIAKYDREFGGKSVLWNQDALNEYGNIIIQEGEFNAATLVKYGYKNVVGLTVGAGTLDSNWYDLLYQKDKFILSLDPDSVGQAAARNVWAMRLGVDRCWNLELPKNVDVNDFFKDHTKEDFDKIIKSATRFTVDGIISLTDTLYEMYNQSLDPENQRVFELPWDNVNKLLGGGLQRKRLTVLGGKAGIGKTSLAMQILYHLAKVYKMPGLFFCLEMPEVSLAVKIIQMHFDLTINEVNFGDALLYETELNNIPIYFGYSSKIKPDVFYRTMKEARNRYGIEFGVFDNLQRMIRTGEESDMGNAIGMFKDLTMDLNIPFIVVSQPRKMSSSNITPTNEDFKGSSAISQDADETIWIHRKEISNNEGDGFLSPIADIIIPKTRFSSGGKTKLEFIGAKSTFNEIKE